MCMHMCMHMCMRMRMRMYIHVHVQLLNPFRPVRYCGTVGFVAPLSGFLGAQVFIALHLWLLSHVFREFAIISVLSRALPLYAASR